MRREKIDEIIAVVLLCVLIIITFLQVLFRFVLNLPLAWSEEGARYTFIFLVYLSASIAVKENNMITINLLNTFVRKSIIRVINMLIYTFCASFSIFITYLCYNLITKSMSLQQKTPALGIPVWSLYALEGLLFLLIGIRYILIILNYKNLSDLLIKDDYAGDSE